MGHVHKHLQGHISGVFRPGLLPTRQEAQAEEGMIWGNGTGLTWGDGTVVDWSNP